MTIEGSAVNSGASATTFEGVATGLITTTGTSTVGASGGSATNASLTDPARTVSGTANVDAASTFTGTISGTVSMQGGTAASSGTVSNVRITEEVTSIGEVLIAPGARIDGGITGQGKVENGTLITDTTVPSEDVQCCRSPC